MKNILLATTNQGKLKEFQAILGSGDYTLLSQDTNEIVEETGATFVENALIKARSACLRSGLMAIADDSGLVVPALNGAPGIFSARFSGIQANDQSNRAELLQEMQSLSLADRKAYFYCTIVLLRTAEDPTPLIAQASWHGEITEEERGNNGFGYDAIFYIPSLQRTAAELSSEEKNHYSHRAKALQLLQQLIVATH